MTGLTDFRIICFLRNSLILLLPTRDQHAPFTRSEQVNLLLDCITGESNYYNTVISKLKPEQIGAQGNVKVKCAGKKCCGDELR